METPTKSVRVNRNGRMALPENRVNTLTSQPPVEIPSPLNAKAQVRAAKLRSPDTATGVPVTRREGVASCTSPAAQLFSAGWSGYREAESSAGV